jgi:hypothetical protein
MNGRPLPAFILDSGLLADRYISPTVPEFDYPRSDLPTKVRYVGAVHPAPSRGFRLPPWWPELDGNRPVVQGTIDNADLSRLLQPTIGALGGEDVVVVATTGGRDFSQIKVPLPMNTYVTEYIPHDVLLPKVDVRSPTAATLRCNGHSTGAAEPSGQRRSARGYAADPTGPTTVAGPYRSEPGRGCRPSTGGGVGEYRRQGAAIPQQEGQDPEE